MPRQVEVRTPLEELLVEQALLMARAFQAAADAAPDGHVLAQAEQVAVRAGRERTRRALEAAGQAQAHGAEKKLTAPTSGTVNLFPVRAAPEVVGRCGRLFPLQQPLQKPPSDVLPLPVRGGLLLGAA